MKGRKDRRWVFIRGVPSSATKQPIAVCPGEQGRGGGACRQQVSREDWTGASPALRRSYLFEGGLMSRTPRGRTAYRQAAPGQCP